MKKCFNFLLTFFFAFLSKAIGFSWIVGSWSKSFSCVSMIAPVLGLHAGLFSMLVWLLDYKVITMGLPLFALHRLPLLFGIVQYRYKDFFTTVFVPFVCMVLFWSHVKSSLVSLYALYWLIPIILYYVKRSAFLDALATVMTMHAVGTIVWIYSIGLSEHIFIALAPVVIVERSIMALGIVCCNQLVIYSVSWYETLSQMVKKMALGA